MTPTDDPLSRWHAEHAQDPVRSSRRARRGLEAPRAPEREDPRVEIVEAPGLRWINIERPRPADRAWLEERFDFHPLDYEDVFSRNQRPKVDEYDDYLFIVLHFPRYDKAVARLNAAELDLFVGPDFLITLPNEPLQPVEYLFERCRTNEELREQIFSKGPGYLLYKIVDDCVDASFPMLRKIGNKLERIEQDIFEGRSAEIVRDISNAKQEIINFRKVIRPQRAAFCDLERNKQRYIADDLDIYFDDIVDASERDVGHARELQGGRGGARVHQRDGHRPPLDGDRPHPHRLLGDLPAAHPDRLGLGHERARARPGQHAGVLRVLVVHGRHARRAARAVPPPRVAVAAPRW